MSEPVTNGVHRCTETSLYKVVVGGAVIAESADRTLANIIYIAHVQRARLETFPPSLQWMVEAYGD